MRVVWVLTVLRLVAGGAPGVEANSIPAAQVHGSAPAEVRTERVTIGFYASKAACDRMRAQLSHASGFKPGSAQCVKQLN